MADHPVANCGKGRLIITTHAPSHLKRFDMWYDTLR